MEAELLRGMIADRDLRMTKIQQKSEEQIQRNVELCQQLENVSDEAQKQALQITAEKNLLFLQYKGVRAKLEQMQRDFKQQGASLKTYSKDSSAIGKVGANGGDASYVMRMQAQLCKAMHSLGITDHQMELATKHTDLIVKYQKETLVRCREERTTTELQLMNLLIGKDNERRTIEDSYQAKLDVIAKERDALERQMEESGHNLEDEDDEKNDDDDDEEDDPEEKEMKQELMQVLTEKRAEMERLDVLTEEQEELIADLEEQMAEIGSPGGASSEKITQRKSQELYTTTAVSTSSPTPPPLLPPPPPPAATTMNDDQRRNENIDEQQQEQSTPGVEDNDDTTIDEQLAASVTPTEQLSDVVEENDVDHVNNNNNNEPTVEKVDNSIEKEAEEEGDDPTEQHPTEQLSDVVEENDADHNKNNNEPTVEKVDNSINEEDYDPTEQQLELKQDTTKNSEEIPITAP